VILVSWGLRWWSIAWRCRQIAGQRVYSTAQIKTMQEVITLVVFVGFSALYLGEGVTWRHALGFALIALGRGLCFRRRVEPLRSAPVSRSEYRGP
jgi:uncharacterized protein (DUF486 family)